MTWDGITVALNIIGILSPHKSSMVSLEVKSSKNDLLEKIKAEFDEFLNDLTEGYIV